MTIRKPDETIVWIVNQAGHDYSSSEKYGRNLALSIGNVDPFRVDRRSYDICNAIGIYTKKDDFLLLSGAPILNGLAFAAWLRMHKTVNLLQWHAKRREYLLSTYDANQLDTQLQNAIERRGI